MQSRSRRDRTPAKRRRPAPVSDSFRERRLACLWPSAATRNAVAGISITMTGAAPRDAYRTRAMRCRGHPTRDQKGGRGQARDAGFGTEVASGAFVIWRTDPLARIVYLVFHGGRSETREGSARPTGRAQAAGSQAAATAVARGEHRPGFAALRGRRGPGPQEVPVARCAVPCRSRTAIRGNAPAGTITTTIVARARVAQASWAFRSTVTKAQTSAAARSAAVARPTAKRPGIAFPLREAEASLLALNAAHQREPHPGFDAERGGLERLARHKDRVAAHHVAHR